MPSQTTPPPTGMDALGPGDAFTLLLQILNMSGDASDARKAVGAARAAGKLGAKVAGYPEYGKYIGYAGDAAGLGLTLADIANSDLKTSDKVEAGLYAGADTAASIWAPYYREAKFVDSLGKKMSQSSSPQVRGVGRATDEFAIPEQVELMMAGRPKDSFEEMGKSLLMGGPAIGGILKGLGLDDNVLSIFPGLNHKPTTGTQFRDTFNTIAGKAGFKGFKGTEQYNMDPEKWMATDPKTRAAATSLGYFLSSFSPQFKKNPYAYGIQGQNVLANQYGDEVVAHADRLLKEVKPEDVFKQVASAGGLAPEQLASFWNELSTYYGLKPGSAMPTL